MKVRVTEAAEAEIGEAMVWYERQQDGLGADFKAKVRETIAAIGSTPEHFGVYEGGGTQEVYRRAILERFPYVVLFRVDPKEIVVHAVLHGSREPGYWEGR